MSEGEHDRNGRTASVAVTPSLDVLVVDDEPATASALVRAITALGHTCRRAGTGEEALELIGQRRPDVVVSDWEMPGMTGAELCRRARMLSGREDGFYTYFILVTGHDDKAHRLAGMEAGADDFQKKPVDVDELEARLVSASRVVALHKKLAEQTAQLRRESRRLYVAARTDPLTGVHNRLALTDELQQLHARAARYDHRYALAICDVDLFKRYNDFFGHVAGDHALCAVADAIRHTVRATDAIYRYGGEEFVILFPEQSLAQAALAMERVRAAVEALAIPTAEGGPLTVSGGVAEVDPRQDRTPEAWIARADAALYRAKANGRNRVETASSQS